MSRPTPQPGSPGARAVVPLLLVLLIALFLFPYLFQGRSMLPLELIPIFQPWARHARELWGTVPPVHNPLLDALQQYYPRRDYMGAALHGGWLPLWIPYWLGGSPFLATQQASVLYPPAWLLSLLSPERQFGLSAFLHLGLAVVGGYLFFRELGLRRPGAAAGAAAFALNGYVVVWLAYPNVTQWTLCWLPLALWLWERGRRGDDLRWMALCALALGFNLLGGHGQSASYLLLTWGFWALLRSLAAGRPVRCILRWVALPGLLGVGLAMGQLLPAFDYVPRTDRGGRVPWPHAVNAGMPLSQLWTFLLPRLFGDATLTFAQSSWLPPMGKAGLAFIERSFYPGASVLVLASGAAAVPRAWSDGRRLALFSLGLAALALLWALATPLYWPLWRLLPGFGNFTAVGRIVSMAAWPLACLAALGVHCLTAEEEDVRARAFRALLLAGILGALAALIGHFIYGGAAPERVGAFLAQRGMASVDSLALRDLALALLWLLAPALLAGLALRGLLKPALAGGLAALVVAADLFSFGFGFNPAADPTLARQTTPELDALRALQARGDLARFLSCGPRGREEELKERMPSNLPALYRFGDINGTDSFFPRRYLEWRSALHASSGGGSPWSRPGAPNLRSAAVRYYLTGSRALFPGLRPLVETAVQEDPQALPYARLHTHVQALPTKEELLRVLSLPNRAPVVALTTGVGAPIYGGLPRVTPFFATRPNGNRVRLSGEAPEAGLLVVSEGFEPGWRARVDGVPVRPVPADWLLTGIPLERGRHTVELVYAPDAWRVGLFLSLAALACAAGLLAGARGTGTAPAPAETEPATPETPPSSNRRERRSRR